MLTKFYLNEKAKFRIIARKISDFACLALAKKASVPGFRCVGVRRVGSSD
jgi:hypothetical protein